MLNLESELWFPTRRWGIVYGVSLSHYDILSIISSRLAGVFFAGISFATYLF